MFISSHLGSAILETPLKICGSQFVKSLFDLVEGKCTETCAASISR